MFLLMKMTRPYFRNPYRLGTKGWLTEGSFSLSNFAGGLNNVDPDTNIADNELTDTKNMKFMGSIMETRPGTVYVNNSSFTNLNAPITWTDRYQPLLNNSHTVRATATEIYIDDTKLCDIQGNVRGVNYVGKYYFVDGHNLFMYDGTDYYKIIQDPTGYTDGETASNSTTIKLKKIPENLAVGDTVYVVKSVIKTEADVTKTVSAINTETKTITINSAVGSVIPKDSPILFYTPRATSYTVGEQVFDSTNHLAYYKPCINELSDSYAGASYIPDAPDLIAVHKSRLIVTGDSTQPHGVYMSATTEPLYFPVSAGVSVKPNGEKIIDLIPFDDALIIARHEDMYVLYGETEYANNSSGLQSFSIQQMDVTTGVMSAGCGAMLNNFYIYLGYDGIFYRLNTPTTFVEYLMTKPLPRKCDIYEAPISLTRNSIHNCSAIAYRNEVYFGIGNNLVIVYNYDNQAFTYYVGWKNSSLYTDGITVYIGTTEGDFLKYDDINKSYTDLGVAIDCRLHTKRFDFGDAIGYKYFKMFMVTSHAYDNLQSNITSKVEVDYFDNPVNTTINSNLAQFGIAKWGMVRFNNRNLFKSPYMFLDVSGRTIMFKFSTNSLNTTDNTGQPFRIYDINILYSSRDVR